MILIGGRIFGLFWSLDMCALYIGPILVNIDGYHTYRHITRARNV